MDHEPTATVSPRWDSPEQSEDGMYWRARLRRLDDAGVIDHVAYGPDRAACVREAARQDRAWVRAADRETARERQRFLEGGDTQ